VGVLRFERAALARDDRVRVERSERGLFPRQARDRERRARERLARVETWDGLLAEAYDEATGAVAARHWFAWPAALRALLEREPMLTAP
jgi:hypothetical protein